MTKNAQSIVGSSPGRNWQDFYPTPPEATEALLSVEQFTGGVWEPACGDGAISRVLEARGFTVTSSDLVDRGYGEPRRDFLLFPAYRCIDNIITNPPKMPICPSLATRTPS